MFIGTTLIFLVFGVLTAYVASDKGMSVALWFVIGLLLGPFGIYAAWRIGSKYEQHHGQSHHEKPEENLEFQTLVKKLQHEHHIEDRQQPPGKFTPEKLTKKCPECGGRIKLKAMVCNYCNRSFTLEEVQNQIRHAWQRHHGNSGQSQL